MRHAVAIPRGTPGYATDAQRPLTMDGHTQARQVAEGLKRLRIPIGVIATSPYVRAAQTAERVARVFGPHVQIIELEALTAEARPADTSKALTKFASQEHVVCVGHEPHVSAWLAELVAKPDGLQVLMKKGGVACVEIEKVPPPTGSGTLRWLMTPKQLTLIGKAD
jgi:phosphohistidine phosphatase